MSKNGTPVFGALLRAVRFALWLVSLRGVRCTSTPRPSQEEGGEAEEHPEHDAALVPASTCLHTRCSLKQDLHFFRGAASCDNGSACFRAHAQLLLVLPCGSQERPLEGSGNVLVRFSEGSVSRGCERREWLTRTGWAPQGSAGRRKNTSVRRHL